MAEIGFQEKIKKYFISLDLKPGDKIETEIALAEKFGVSRYKMRQALDVMVQAGILERAPKRGTVIKGFDTDSLSEHIKFQFEVSQFDTFEFKEARILMERAILPLAVRRITPSEIAKVEQTIEDMLLHQDDPKKADGYDRDFHLLIFQSCGNHVLSAFSGVLSTLFRSSEYRNKYWSQERIVKIAEEHKLILSAIKKGDPLAAVAALDVHLGYSKLTLAE
ncbi:FadR/GntR family transcriptional regulator [Sodalis sp. RH21]|uniref:FadR/GntR family transcriptional regulator n=1 Tax=unclassified Sodalis (in: enterobacteria) TaxID=2636512 RepID=UPI0039B5CCB7